MEKEISGMIRNNPISFENGCLFFIEQQKKLFLVLSAEEQAVKDAVFLRTGQEMKIQGLCLNALGLEGIIIAKKSRITRLEKSSLFENTRMMSREENI